MWPFKAKAKDRWEIRPKISDPPESLGIPPKVVFEIHDHTGRSVPWRGQMMTGVGTLYATVETREKALELIERREAVEQQLATEERTDVPARD